MYLVRPYYEILKIPLCTCHQLYYSLVRKNHFAMDVSEAVGSGPEVFSHLGCRQLTCGVQVTSSLKSTRYMNMDVQGAFCCSHSVPPA